MRIFKRWPADRDADRRATFCGGADSRAGARLRAGHRLASSPSAAYAGYKSSGFIQGRRRANGKLKMETTRRDFLAITAAAAAAMLRAEPRSDLAGMTLRQASDAIR